MDPAIASLRDLIGHARRIAVFTGAGISTESGIPDFRGPNGIWTKYDPSEFTIQNFLRSTESRRRYWRRSGEMYRQILASRPNAAHLAVARLEAEGRLGAVITQNVDGLHQAAGNSPGRVIELHGTALDVACLSCGARQSRQAFQPQVQEDGTAPDCPRCGGLIKPATISFGQSLVPDVVNKAEEETEASDLFLVVGSSLQVYPAAGLPLLAASRGTPLAIVNMQETPHDGYAQVVVRGMAGEVLSAAATPRASPVPLPV